MECVTKFIFFLCLGCVVLAQDDRDGCPTKTELLARCSIGCIDVTRESFPCPTCTDRLGCADVVDECRPGDTTSCGDNQLCLATGAAGRYTCVDLLGDGASCNVTTDDFDDAIESVRDFLPDLNSRETFDSVIDVVIPCQRGLVCRRVSLTERQCRPEISGPCTIRRRTTDPLVECDDDGNFEPLQCRMDATSGNYRCQCVEPSGDRVPDTLIEVPSRSDAPDCDDIVNDRCKFVSRLGISYEVRSGLPLIDPEQCRRCICDDGEFTLCRDVGEGCQVINPEPRDDGSCSLRGRTIQDGDSVEVRCNRCGCRNGELFCTRRDCDDDDEEDDEAEIGEDPDDSEEDRNCRRCRGMPASPVCGSDGRTYPSRCFAMNCRGLSADNIIPGPCSRENICETFPCADNEFCFRAGGVTCLRSSGCPERLRRCVNLEQLMCRSRDDDGDGDGDETEEAGSSGEEETPAGEEESESSDGDEEERDRVCGSDLRTYPNICALFQNSAGIQVAYSGSCNRTECLGGMVCGTDGVTYGNICELRTNSANARVDYRGACMDNEDDDDNVCQLVRRSGRCADVSDCSFVVRPADSCCPICGGAIVIRLAREILDEIVRLNPRFETLNDVIKSLIADGFIPDNILRACRLAASILDTAELQLVMESVIRDDNTCRNFLDTVADRINNPDTSGTTSLPQILQAATVAEPAPLVEESNGAVKLLPLTLVMMLLPLLALFF